MKNVSPVEWILRIGVFGTFLGHGIFALQIKQSWIPLLTAVGFSEMTATSLLPLIGVMDIVVEIIVMFMHFIIVMMWEKFWEF